MGFYAFPQGTGESFQPQASLPAGPMQSPCPAAALYWCYLPFQDFDKKGLNDPGNHDGVVTNLEPDILEPEVKWALGSMPMNKARGGD